MLFTMRKTVQVTHELNRHNPIPYPLYTHSQNFPKSLTLPQEFFHKRSFTLALLISLTLTHGRAKCSHHLFGCFTSLHPSTTLSSPVPLLMPNNYGFEKATKHGFEKVTKHCFEKTTKHGTNLAIIQQSPPWPNCTKVHWPYVPACTL